MASLTVPDLRGKMFRSKRLMSDADAREFLRKQKTAHVGTVDGRGWPYVVPLVYVYGQGDYLYLHTSATRSTDLRRGRRYGPLHKGKRFACDSALVYTSVVVFGPARILYHDREKKAWFLDRLLAKHGDPSWSDTRQLAWR